MYARRQLQALVRQGRHWCRLVAAAYGDCALAVGTGGILRIPGPPHSHKVFANVPTVGAKGAIEFLTIARQPIAVVTHDELRANAELILKTLRARLKLRVFLDEFHDLALQVENLSVQLNIVDLLNRFGKRLDFVENAQCDASPY